MINTSEIDKFIQTCESNKIALESSNNKPEIEERIYKIKAMPYQLKTIEAIFSYIEYLGNIGHSTSFTVYVDGDGNARLQISDENGKDILNVNDNKDYIKSKMNEDHDIKSFGFD